MTRAEAGELLKHLREDHYRWSAQWTATSPAVWGDTPGKTSAAWIRYIEGGGALRDHWAADRLRVLVAYLARNQEEGDKILAAYGIFPKDIEKFIEDNRVFLCRIVRASAEWVRRKELKEKST